MAKGLWLFVEGAAVQLERPSCIDVASQYFYGCTTRLNHAHNPRRHVGSDSDTRFDRLMATPLSLIRRLTLSILMPLLLLSQQ